MIRALRFDLHVHTVLSPCSELSMTPAAAAAAAKACGIACYAVCDHNASANVPAYRAAAASAGLAVIAGIEITSKEEAHVLGYFDDAVALAQLQAEIYASLPGKNDPDTFGIQAVIDETEDVLELDDHLLIGATTMSLEKVVGLILGRGGVAVASHIDREGFSITGQLGFIPPGLALDAVEVSPRSTPDMVRAAFPDAARYPVLCSSDAHRPSEIGSGWTDMMVEAPTAAEIRLAIRGEAGRRIVGTGRRA